MTTQIPILREWGDKNPPEIRTVGSLACVPQFMGKAQAVRESGKKWGVGGSFFGGEERLARITRRVLNYNNHRWIFGIHRPTECK